MIHFLEGVGDGTPFVAQGPLCKAKSYGMGTRVENRVSCDECKAVLKARELLIEGGFDETFVASSPRVVGEAALELLILDEVKRRLLSAGKEGFGYEVESQVAAFAEAWGLGGLMTGRDRVEKAIRRIGAALMALRS